MRSWLAVASLVLASAGCWPEAGCGAEVLQQVVSPDGERTATVFARNCGATADSTTSVQVRPGTTEDSKLRQDVVFVAVANGGAAPAGPGGGPEVRIRWTADDRLEVAHHPRVRLIRQEPWHRGIHIDYVLLPRQPGEWR